jgi:hypothetical protein
VSIVNSEDFAPSSTTVPTTVPLFPSYEVELAEVDRNASPHPNSPPREILGNTKYSAPMKLPR